MSALPRVLLLAALLTAAATGTAVAAPVDGRTASVRAGELISGDGSVLRDRADGHYVVAASADGLFDVHVRRRGGLTVAAGVDVNGSDRVLYDRESGAFYLNGVEWNPQNPRTYNLPNGGTVGFAGPTTTITSPAGDVAVLRAEDDLPVLVTVAAGRQDGEVMGLPGRWDSGSSPADDPVDASGAFQPDRAARLAAWRIADPASSLAAKPGWVDDDICQTSRIHEGRRWDWDTGTLTVDDAQLLAGAELLLGAAAVPAAPATCGADARRYGVIQGIDPAAISAAGLPATVRVERHVTLDPATDVWRFLTVIRNDGAAPVSVAVRQRFTTASGDPLEVLDSSAAPPAAVDAGDDWMVVRRVGGGPASALVWRGSDPRRAQDVVRVHDTADPSAWFATGGISPVVDFGRIEVPPGAARAVAVFQHVGGDPTVAAAVAADPSTAVGILSPADRDALANAYVAAADPDLDGVGVAADACPSVAGPNGGCPPPPQPPVAPAPPDGRAPDVAPETAPVPGLPAPPPAILGPVRPSGLRVTAWTARRDGRRVVVVRGAVTLPAETPAGTCTGAEVHVRLTGGRGGSRAGTARLTPGCTFVRLLPRPRATRPGRSLAVAVVLPRGGRLLPVAERGVPVHRRPRNGR